MTEKNVAHNFITEAIDHDLKEHKYPKIVTRFPPEPNGYLHIGHAKSICLNFGLAEDYHGECNLRFDDTNPETEDPEFVHAIESDVRWLGFEPARITFASDFFELMEEVGVELIKAGKAYVDSVSDEEMRALRGTISEAGKPSPYRDRSMAENLDMFARMREGEFPDGAHVLRAKIDLSHPNFKMRDPVLFRILKAQHYHVGWRNIYPLYDFAHPLEDFIEGVSHSICSLEFENNRAIYNWLIENVQGKLNFPEYPRPYQYEQARLNLDYTLMSKRKLKKLVEGGYVEGWDDPRMPTVSGLRRRGVRPEAIREFSKRVGVAKTNSRTEMGLLESTIRDDLNFIAPRVMAVTDPLKVTLTNYPESEELLHVPYWSHEIGKEGTRDVPFSPVLYVERSDFMEVAEKGFKRLTLGGTVRLRYAYNITCHEVVKDVSGNVVELKCTYHPESKENTGGVKSIIHWVSDKAIPAEFKLYDTLFTVPDPEEGEEGFLKHLNPHSLRIARGYIEPSVLNDPPETRYQFERLGYFWRDPKATDLVFNRIVTLKDHKKEELKKTAAKPVKAQAQTATPELSEDERIALAPFSAQGIALEEAKVLHKEPALAEYVRLSNNSARSGSWVVNVLAAEILAGTNRITIAALDAVLDMVDNGAISGRIAKDVLAEAQEKGIDPTQLIAQKGLKQVSDSGELAPLIDAVFAQYPEKVAAYRSGKTGMLGFFVGQVMKASQGQANPQLLNELILQKLS